MTAPAANPAPDASPKGFQTIVRGPQIGVPPSLEQVPVDRLSVDQTYQRATNSPNSRKIIVDMVKGWDWTLCQPLVVARRDDGTLWILDVQHRHAGAVERGDIYFLPCVILSSLDRQGEARTFVKLNTKRQKLNQAEIFHGMLAAGDPDAQAVQMLLDETGWKVVRSTGTNNWRAGDMQCAPMLVKYIKARGEATVRFALTALRAAYPDTAVRQSSTLLKALFDAFDMLMDEQGVSVAMLIAAIGAVVPDAWPVKGVAYKETHPNLSETHAIARAMIRAARGDAVPAAPRPAPARPAPAHPAQQPAKMMPVAAQSASVPHPFNATRDDAFVYGTSGKGWCSQCEQLVSRDKARACGSSFCKARGQAAAA